MKCKRIGESSLSGRTVRDVKGLGTTDQDTDQGLIGSFIDEVMSTRTEGSTGLFSGIVRNFGVHQQGEGSDVHCIRMVG